MTQLKGVPRLACAPLKEIYVLIDQARCDEIQAADKGAKVAFTRLRVKLSQISKLCKKARKELLAMRDGNTEMEKYGVDEEQEAKTAASESETTYCPQCGAVAEKHGTVLKCPRHGTEPFEKKE